MLKTTQTPVFTINLDCKPLHIFAARTETELQLLRAEADRRHEAGMAIQKQIKRNINEAYLRYAATFVR
jgi:hypothetical protein